MGRMNRPMDIPISRRAAGALRRGHPWLLREGSIDAPIGAMVRLTNGGDPIAWGLVDEGPIAVRVLGREDPGPLASLAVQRVQRADGVRVRLLDASTDGYRVVSGAGDGLPGVVIDRYGSLAVLRLYSRAWEVHLEVLVEAIAKLPWVTNIYRRFGVERVDGRSGGEVLHGAEPAECLVYTENGMKLIVRPLVGQKTGMFLDQRAHRAMVRRWSAGRMVANLFGYTGGFSVAAALGGAAHVTTVDIAPDAIEDARENFRLNGLDPDEHGFDVSDAFAWRPRGAIDLLVLDPPSLTRGRRSDEAAQRAYRKLHAHHGAYLPRDGLLATSSCTSRLDLLGWCRAVADGLGDAGGEWSWHHRSSEPPDHPVALAHREAHYLKFALVRRRDRPRSGSRR